MKVFFVAFIRKFSICKIKNSTNKKFANKSNKKHLFTTL